MRFWCCLVFLSLYPSLYLFASVQDGTPHNNPPIGVPESQNPVDNKNVIIGAVDSIKNTQKELQQTADSIEGIRKEISNAKTQEDKKRLEQELDNTIKTYDDLVNRAKTEFDALNKLTEERASVDPSQRPEIEKINKELKPIFDQFDKKRNLTDELKDLKSQLDKARTSGDPSTLKKIEDKIKEIQGKIKSHFESGEKIGSSLNYSYENASKELKTIEDQLSKLKLPPQISPGTKTADLIPPPNNPNPQQTVPTPKPAPSVALQTNSFAPTPSIPNPNPGTETPTTTPPTGHTFPNNPMTNSNPVISTGPDFGTPTSSVTSVTAVPSESVTPSTITNTTFSPIPAESRAVESSRSPGSSIPVLPPSAEVATQTTQSPSPTTPLTSPTDSTPIVISTPPTKSTIGTDLAVSNPTPPTVSMTAPGPMTVNPETKTNTPTEAPRALKDPLNLAPTDQNPKSDLDSISVDIPKPSSGSSDNRYFSQMKETSNRTDSDVGTIGSPGTDDSVTRILSEVGRMGPTEKKPSYITELLKGGKLPPKPSESPRGLASLAKKSSPQKTPQQKTKPQTLLGMLFAWLGL